MEIRVVAIEMGGLNRGLDQVEGKTVVGLFA